ncbi:MAG: hypothetical protein DRO11_09720 [Methanobacteriota archaeon]|nr:MAG: hypothetical protein DRO11_09720 [Euryarchaeota archaeon]
MTKEKIAEIRTQLIAGALYRSDIKQAKDYLSQLESSADNAPWWRGYISAVRSSVRAVETDDKLSFIVTAIRGGFTPQRLRELSKNFEARSSHTFRSEKERGYNKAWTDLLEGLAKAVAENMLLTKTEEE